MSKIDLNNVIPLGVLEEGIYPQYHSKSISDPVQWKSEEDGVNVAPALFLYFRKSSNINRNGHLFLYKSDEQLEIDLTTLSIYDNSALFKLTDKSDVKSLNIEEFESRAVVNNVYNYNTTWIKPTEKYLHFLVPADKCVVTTYLNGMNVNNLFTLSGVYIHDNKSWWIYSSNFTSDFNFENPKNEILSLNIHIRRLDAEDLNPINNILSQLNDQKTIIDNLKSDVFKCEQSVATKVGYKEVTLSDYLNGIPIEYQDAIEIANEILS